MVSRWSHRAQDCEGQENWSIFLWLFGFLGADKSAWVLTYQGLLRLQPQHLSATETARDLWKVSDTGKKGCESHLCLS